MGFYSFYRIFKDIIKTLFGNKAFKYFLIFAIICVVVLFANKSFASSTITGYNLSIRLLSSGHVLPSFNDYDTSNQQLYNAFVFPVFEGNTYTFTPTKSCNYGFISDLTPFMISGETYRASDDLVDALVTIPIFKINTTSTTYVATSDGYVVVGGYSSGTFTCSCTSTGDGDSNLSKIQEDVHQIYNYLSIIRSNWNYLLDALGNIQANQLETQELLKALLGIEGEGVDKDFSTVSGIVAAANGSFVSSTNYSTVYFKCDAQNNYSVSFTIGENALGDDIRYGYTYSVPSTGVSWSSRSIWGGVDNPINFTASNSSYFYVSYYRPRISNVSVKSNKNLIDNINNQAQETRETLTDSNISQDTADYTLPSDSTNDITQDGFNTIFERIRSTFTSGSSTPLVVTIPFTNKSFTISYDTVYGSANLGLVRSIIESFWWFVISLFITKDIFKKIEKIKTGNIEFTETTNIKEDIL